MHKQTRNINALKPENENCEEGVLNNNIQVQDSILEDRQSNRQTVRQSDIQTENHPDSLTLIFNKIVYRSISV